MDLSIVYSPTQEKPRAPNGFYEEWLLENISVGSTLKIVLVSDAAA